MFQYDTILNIQHKSHNTDVKSDLGTQNAIHILPLLYLG